MRPFIATLIGLNLCVGIVRAKAESLDEPVTIGQYPNLDACVGYGEVTGLDPNGDNFLSVRSGPGGRPYREIDRVHTGDGLALCSRRNAWYGVVYGGPADACGVTRPVSSPRSYKGPCRSGWVHSRYVRGIAGGSP